VLAPKSFFFSFFFPPLDPTSLPPVSGRTPSAFRGKLTVPRDYADASFPPWSFPNSDPFPSPSSPSSVAVGGPQREWRSRDNGLSILIPTQILILSPYPLSGLQKALGWFTFTIFCLSPILNWFLAKMTPSARGFAPLTYLYSPGPPFFLSQADPSQKSYGSRVRPFSASP